MSGDLYSEDLSYIYLIFFLKQLRLVFNLQQFSYFGLLHTGVTSVYNHAQTYSWQAGKKKAWGGEVFISLVYDVLQARSLSFISTIAIPPKRGNYSYGQLFQLQ